MNTSLINSLFVCRFEDYTEMDIIGAIFFVIGLITEAISDQQKFNFRNNPENRYLLSIFFSQ